MTEPNSTGETHQESESSTDRIEQVSSHTIPQRPYVFQGFSTEQNFAHFALLRYPEVLTVPAPHSFIAKITLRGGPDPGVELDSLVRVAEEREAEGTLGTVWFPTRAPGDDIVLNEDSRVLIIGPVRKGHSIDAVFATVAERQSSFPTNDPCARELYEGCDEFTAWWLLKDPQRLRISGLEKIPGHHHGTDRPAQESFNSPLTFACWSLPRAFSGVDGQEESARDPRPATPRLPLELSQKDSPGLHTCFFGVDFSGGREAAAGNPKIWIAKWDTANGQLTLRSGTDGPGFRRRDLPKEIASDPGFWLMDFPFGIPSEIAQLTTSSHHADWWRKCAAAVAEENGATTLRDTIRAAADNANVKWSTKRRVDTQHGTTWFPLFEQLYRQTMFGAGEVLSPLEGVDNVAILPWDATQLLNKASVVAEGFPGITLRNRLGLPGSGYKGKTASHQVRRNEIISHLRHLLPIQPDIAERASADREGDAIDALLLVVAAQATSRITPSEWAIHLETLTVEGRRGEGWFPA